MYELAPSVYAANILNIKKQVEMLESGGANYLHVDIMDGHFVPGLSFGPGFVAALRSCTDMILDVHLMMTSPGKFIHDFSDAGADIITVHLEAEDDPENMLNLIHSKGKRAGVVLKPATPVEAVSDGIWEKIDVIQIMTVEPGMRGQTFISSSVEKIRKTREIIDGRQTRNPAGIIELEVDGDITPRNLREVLGAGANIVVAGKGLFFGSLTQNMSTYMEIMRTCRRLPQDNDTKRRA